MKNYENGKKFQPKVVPNNQNFCTFE